MVHRQLIKVGPVEIWTEQQGDPDAPPVLLLHGGSSFAATWAAFGAVLAERGYRAIAIDQRGHGRTSHLRPYGLATLANDVLGVIDVLGLTRVSLIGHSLGGYAASAAAGLRPDGLHRVVLEEPAVPSRVSGDRPPVSRLELLKMGVAGALAKRSFALAAILRPVEELRVPNPDWWQGLREITAPTLVLAGGPESYMPPERFQALVDELPDGRLVTIPAGHRVHSLAPELFRQTVLDFLGPPPA